MLRTGRKPKPLSETAGAGGSARVRRILINDRMTSGTHGHSAGLTAGCAYRCQESSSHRPARCRRRRRPEGCRRSYQHCRCLRRPHRRPPPTGSRLHAHAHVNAGGIRDSTTRGDEAALACRSTQHTVDLPRRPRHRHHHHHSAAPAARRRRTGGVDVATAHAILVSQLAGGQHVALAVSAQEE